MKKLFNILRGWLRYLFFPRSEMADKRLEICFDCDWRKGNTCGVCGCHLKAKAEVKEEECPLNRW